MARLYIYEALAIVLASVFLGTSLGIFTAIVVTLQTNLFADLPFVFYFPTAMFVFVVVLSLGVAFLGSLFPSEKFRKQQIAITLRG